MQWLRAHVYISALGLTGFLFVAGTFIVVTRSSGPPRASQTVAWGGTGAVLNPSYMPGAATPQGSGVGIMQQVQNGAPYAYILPAPASAQPSSDAGSADNGGFDFNAFISALSQESAPGTTPPPGAAAPPSGAYAFIPGGLVSTTTTGVKRTELQQSMYDYGNEVGSFVQSFEQSHPNSSELLMDQAQDRANPGKVSAVQSLGRALTGLGDSLLAMDSVPSQLKPAHEALAKSYRDMGQKLVLVPQAGSDGDFVAAVEAYNTAAETFTGNYVELANLFVSYGVTFSEGDPGSVFTFSSTGL